MLVVTTTLLECSGLSPLLLCGGKKNKSGDKAPQSIFSKR